MIPVPPEILANLAAQYGMNPVELREFGGGQPSSDGIVYERIKGGKTILLKVMPFDPGGTRTSLLRFNARLAFMQYLGDHGAQIAFPLPLGDGALYALVDHADRTWVAYAMHKMPGTVQSPKGVDHDFIRKWGAAVGKMHRLAAAYPTWLGVEDPESGELILNWQDEVASFRDWCRDPVGAIAWEEMQTRLEALPVDRASFGFIHNDPHLWNLLYDFDTVTVLDFDVANHHWFMTDVAIACQHVLFMQSGGLGEPVHHRERLLDFLRRFREGYITEYELPAGWWHRVDLFIAYRRLLMFTVMYEGIAGNQKHLASWHAMLKAQPEVAGVWLDA